MANSKKASHHHGKAGECLSKGDHKGAAHHMGHALAALRSTAPHDEPDMDDMGGPSDMDADDAMPAKSGLRARLSRFKK